MARGAVRADAVSVRERPFPPRAISPEGRLARDRSEDAPPGLPTPLAPTATQRFRAGLRKTPLRG